MRPKKVVLCVEADENALGRRAFVLETRGYRVVRASSSQEALEVLARTPQGGGPGGVDLLLADLLLPGMDGNELVRRAKLLHPGLPCLIVSGTVASYERALGADRFLPKGAESAAELLECVRVLVARKRGPRKVLRPVPEASHEGTAREAA